MDKFFVELKREPSVQLSCSIVAQSSPSSHDTLIICLSGIDNPQTIWYPIITALQERKFPDLPPILVYDRVGQGTSIGRNADMPGRPTNFGRDCLDAARDLREIVENVAITRFNLASDKVDGLRIFLVASSIGCAIARLYAQTYPRTVIGLLLLDSTLANSDTVSIFHDPTSPGFSIDNLPAGVTPEALIRARKITHKFYHPTSWNREGLWRGNLPDLLPYADSPRIQGPIEGAPYVTIVEHDHSLFPINTERLLGVPSITAQIYFDPCWHEYNIGLTKITEPHLSKGPIEAKGCGHLIQKDDPQFVVNELLDTLQRLRQRKPSRL